MLRAEWVGRRVSVRRAIARPDHAGEAGAGRTVVATDAVGDLLECSSTRAVLETSTGRVEFDPAHVLLARQSPPSARDVLALEEVLADSLPAAESEHHDGWWLRADDGGTRRANSVLPLGRPTATLDTSLHTAGRWYAERGRPLTLQVPLQGRRLLDAELREQGWEADGADTEVKAMRLDLLAAAITDGDRPVLRIETEPDATWLGIARPQGCTPAQQALLNRPERARFATALDPTGTATAVARVVEIGDWLVISELTVLPAARRTGVARRLLAALAGNAIRHRPATPTRDGEAPTTRPTTRPATGPRRAVVQVAADNASALALYRSLGFWNHHEYRYLRPPAD